MARLSPIKVVGSLPGTNCKECGEDTCMAFAVKMIDHQLTMDMCTPLIKDPKYAKKLKTLKEIATPPIRGVTIGKGPKAVVIGDEEVMYRHELTLYHPTAIFIDVVDDDLDELAKRVETTNTWSIYRLGETFRLDGVAIRCKSNNPEQFVKAIEKTMSVAPDLPIALCSLDPNILRAGAKAAKDKNPLLYAATKENWEEVCKIAQEFDLPVVMYSQDLNELKSLAKTLLSAGSEKIILDPGCAYGEGNVAETIDKHIMLKRAAIEDNDKDVGFPTIGVLSTLYIGKKKDMAEGERIMLAYEEGKMAGLMFSNAVNILIMHNLDQWFQLAMVVVRENIYSDPRINPAVDAKLYEINSPGLDDPVFLTTNYTMTYYTIQSDLQDMKKPAWLLVADTEGISVESAVAGGQFSATKVADAIKETNLAEKVNHKIIIIPGLAARISGELEQLANWKVVVGPRDSSGIPGLMKKYDKEALMKQWAEMQE
ncbi:MAG: acetyl-CoA decarbonylase/synthase complex subunit gamma [Candidatus Lokiarchaeota archaeon]|nr:acetyl-CoA decarbonylase/synthase complex subunit gamma [Candidatus Lokiarchaeota archaeon]